MSWAGTYSHTLALALDRAAAAVFFNRPDITISSLCWIVRNRVSNPIAGHAYSLCKFSGWQTKLLQWIGAGLEFIAKGHCAAARDSDLAVSNSVLALLGEDSAA